MVRLSSGIRVAPRSPVDLPLGRLADVHQLELLAVVEQRLGWAGVRVAPAAALGLVGDDRERLVVDQLGDRQVLAADGALGVLADGDVEGQLEGVVDQQPPDQRVAVPQSSFTASLAWTEPTVAQSTPSTPPSAQEETMPGGGGSLQA